MKRGKIFNIEFIADESNMPKNCANLSTYLSTYLTSLKCLIHGTGIEIYEVGKERFLEWSKQYENSTNQIRQRVTLILDKPMTKDEVYSLINQVQAQPIKF